MSDFEAEEKEAKELVDRFRTMMDSGSSVFFDAEELEIVIDELMREMDINTASEAIEYAIRLYPTDSFFRILRVKKLALQMRLDDAQRELDAIENEFPPNAEFYLEKVMLSKLLGEEDNSFRWLKTALELDPEFPDVHFLLAYEYLKKKDVTQALHHAIFALREDEAFDEQLFSFSFLLEENKQYEDGIAFYMQLTNEFPLYQGCWFGLGLSYSWNKEYDKAIDAYQYVLSINEDTPTAHYNIANCYFESKDYDCALEHYHIAYDQDNEDFNSLTCIADCLALKNKDDEAMNYYQKALAINPNHGDAILGIATLLKEQGKIAEARVFIEKAFALNPQSFELLFESLPYYDEDQQMAKLNEFFNLTLDQLENKTNFYKFFVLYCCENNFYEVARDVLEIHKDDPEITDVVGYYLAAVCFLNNEVKKGSDYLTNALLINYDGRKEFLSFDPILETFPEVNELIELYKP